MLSKERLTSARRGAIALSQAFFLGPLPLVFLGWIQDWYVDVNGPGCPGTGTQADPFCAIGDAVTAAADGDTIHIAPGTYFENVVVDRDLTLIGTGGRDVTILDGMWSGTVVRVTGELVSLSGLTLTNGSDGGLIAAAGGFPYYSPHSAVTLTGSTVTGNGSGGYGGITSLYYCDLTVKDSEVSANYGWVGGIRGGWSNLTVSNSTVTGNVGSTNWRSVGGIKGSGELLNTTVTDNTGSLVGGVWGPYMALTNTTVVGNSATSPSYYGAGGVSLGCFRCWYAQGEVFNSVIHGNSPNQVDGWGSAGKIHHTLVEGGWAGDGNIDADPLFVDSANGDYRLLPGSTCIDAGSNLAVPTTIDTDIRGLPRFLDDPLTPDTGIPWCQRTGRGGLRGLAKRPIVDLGAYEFP